MQGDGIAGLAVGGVQRGGQGVAPAALQRFADGVATGTQAGEVGFAHAGGDTGGDRAAAAVIDGHRPAGEPGFGSLTALVAIGVLEVARVEGGGALDNHSAGEIVAGGGGQRETTRAQIHLGFLCRCTGDGAQHPSTGRKLVDDVGAWRLTHHAAIAHRVAIIRRGVIQAESAQRAGEAEVLQAVRLGI